MASRTLPGIGLKGDWDLGEDGWKDEMDTNLRVLSVVAGQQVLEIVAALPGAPAEGDIVILDETHATHPNEIAVYDEAAWHYIVPLEGMMFLNADDATRYQFNGTIWVDTASTNLPVGGIAGDILTKQSGVDGDADWEAPAAPGSLLTALYEDRRAANVAGGTATTGAWGARILNTEAFDDIGINFLQVGTFTVTIATPAVFTYNAHGLVAGSVILLTTTGALPTGLTASTASVPVPYYVLSTGLTANTFQVSATPGGAAVNTTGSQSGVHTLTASILDGVPAGTYDVYSVAAHYSVNMARTRLRDITDTGAIVTLASSVGLYGSSANAGSAPAIIIDRIVLLTPSRLQLEYRVAVTQATNGLGVVSNWGEDEVYLTLRLAKVS